MLSAAPLIPEGNLLGSGTSWLVMLSLPDPKDQQSSTDTGLENGSFSVWYGLTVHIFVACVFEAKVYHLICCCHDFRLAHIATKRIP